MSCIKHSDCRLTEYCNDYKTCQSKELCPENNDTVDGNNCPCIPGDCTVAEYCSLDGKCYPNDTCEQNRDSFEGSCPYTECNDHNDCVANEKYCALMEVEDDQGKLINKQFCESIEFCQTDGNSIDNTCPVVVQGF